MKVRVKIERIVVDDASAGSARQAEFRVALSAELTKLLIAGGASAISRSQTKNVARVSSPADWNQPTRVGNQVAGHVYSTIRQLKGGKT
jgi:hypothetical protein